MQIKKLTDLPMQMCETNKPTLYPQAMVLDLLEKIQNKDWCVVHLDQSKTVVENIKNMLEILSDNRIKFI